MGFYERITREQEPKIAVHTIQALLGEVERGKITLAAAASILGLDAAEQAEAQTLLNKIVPPRECVSIGGRITLTNIGTTYQNLGVALVQTAGITQVIFGVVVNKVGTGTQSWRLFNDTDGLEVALIDDAGAAGQKTLSTTVNFSPALGAGMKTILLQGKSTVGADDPVFQGGTFSIRRVDMLTPVELHEVLLLADFLGGPYALATNLKTRLGV